MNNTTTYAESVRRLMICTGPPNRENNDKMVADMVATYDGRVMICGGTTARMIARKLNREITVELKRDPSGLPPTSSMEGVEIVSEGVLTLTRVSELLAQWAQQENKQGEELVAAVIHRAEQEGGTAGRIVKIVMNHDVIEFVVGRGINHLHRDPNLPIKLRDRADIVKSLGEILSGVYAKKIRTIFI